MTTLSTGFEGFDECLDGGLHSDSLIVIAAAPASGKTAFTRWLLKQALQKGFSAHLVDMEDTFRKWETLDTVEAIGDEVRFTYQSSWSNEVYDLVPETDLLVVDNLHMAYVPEEDGTIGNFAKWISNVAQRFQAIPYEKKRAVTILTTQVPRERSGVVEIVPRGLAHMAGVIFHMTRSPTGTGHIELTKNRYGTTSGPYEVSLPDMKPFKRRTLWERILDA